LEIQNRRKDFAIAHKRILILLLFVTALARGAFEQAEMFSHQAFIFQVIIT